MHRQRNKSLSVKKSDWSSWRQYFVRPGRQRAAFRKIPRGRTKQRKDQRARISRSTGAIEDVIAGHLAPNTCWRGRSNTNWRKTKHPESRTNTPTLSQPPKPNKLKSHSLTLCHFVAPTPDGHPTSSGQTNKFRRPIPINLAETRAKLS